MLRRWRRRPEAWAESGHADQTRRLNRRFDLVVDLVRRCIDDEHQHLRLPRIQLIIGTRHSAEVGMSIVAHESVQARELIERIETLENVAMSLPEQDHRRSALLALVEKDLAGAPALRPRIAAELLGLSEKTVRAWTEDGILTRADTRSSRLLLDARRVHEVLHLVADLRRTGQTVGLLDEVHRRLVDSTWLDRDDLVESLQQMRRGEGTTRVPNPSA